MLAGLIATPGHMEGADDAVIDSNTHATDCSCGWRPVRLLVQEELRRWRIQDISAICLQVFWTGQPFPGSGAQADKPFMRNRSSEKLDLCESKSVFHHTSCCARGGTGRISIAYSIWNISP